MFKVKLVIWANDLWFKGMNECAVAVVFDTGDWTVSWTQQILALLGPLGRWTSLDRLLDSLRSWGSSDELDSVAALCKLATLGGLNPQD